MSLKTFSGKHLRAIHENLFIRKIVFPFWRYLFNPFLRHLLTVFLGFCAFAFFAYIYPFIGGVSRSEFTQQQLVQTVYDRVGNNSYEFHEVDFLGFGEDSYLVVIDNSERKYTDDYQSYAVHGDVELIIYQEAQKTPIDSLIFSSKLYKEAFSYKFKDSELTFSEVIGLDNQRQQFIFCINNNLCGRLRFGSDFNISALIDNFFCADDYEKNGVMLSRIGFDQRVMPVIHYREDGALFISYPIDWNGEGQSRFLRSSRFQFCVAGRGFSSQCYITKDRYTGFGGNTSLGSIKSFFESENGYTEMLLMQELDACEYHGSGIITGAADEI